LLLLVISFVKVSNESLHLFMLFVVELELALHDAYGRHYFFVQLFVYGQQGELLSLLLDAFDLLLELLINRF
jgi:hypothetical protein